MIKKISFYLLFLLIIYIYSSPCTEKTQLLDGEKKSICESLSTEDDNTITSCIYDEDSKGCKEVTCSSLPFEDCEKFHYKQEQKICFKNVRKYKCELKACSDLKVYDCDAFKSKDINRKCIPTDDFSSCKLQTCSELKNDCGRFYSSNPDETCIFNPNTGFCELKKCSDIKTDCTNEFPITNPAYNNYICEANSATHCILNFKNCRNFDTKNCLDFGLLYRDVPSICRIKSFSIIGGDESKCDLTLCNELPTDQCDEFIYPYEVPKKCVYDSESYSCEDMYCSNFPVSECTSIRFENPNFKCVVNDDECKLSKCTDFNEDNCGEFIPNDILYKCVKNELNNKCKIVEKPCHELPTNKCDKIVYSATRKCVLAKNGTQCIFDDEEEDE